MAEKGHFVVDGYVFETESQARQAKKEHKGICYIKEKLNMDDPEEVLTVYNRIVQEKLFVTPVGYAFLGELQEYLKASKTIRNTDICPLDTEPVTEGLGQNEKEKKNTKTDRLEENGEKYRSRFISSLIVNVVLTFVVVAMFLIMHFSEIPTILNYENKLIDRYETWQKELDRRQQRIEEYEEKYHITDGY